MSGALELIQSFNNPKLLAAVCRSVSFTEGGSLSSSSEISSNCLNCSLKWRTNCSVVPLKLSSRTVLVTYWVSLLFSEAPFEDVFICSLSSFHTAWASVEAKCLLTMVFPMSVWRLVLKTLNMKVCLASKSSCSSGSLPGV